MIACTGYYTERDVDVGKDSRIEVFLLGISIRMLVKDLQPLVDKAAPPFTYL